MPQAEPNARPGPGDANKRNEKDAGEADKRTVANVQKNQSPAERSNAEPGSGG